MPTSHKRANKNTRHCPESFRTKYTHSVHECCWGWEEKPLHEISQALKWGVRETSSYQNQWNHNQPHLQITTARTLFKCLFLSMISVNMCLFSSNMYESFSKSNIFPICDIQIKHTYKYYQLCMHHCCGIRPQTMGVLWSKCMYFILLFSILLLNKIPKFALKFRNFL